MSRKKNILPLAAGILVGMAMSGPAAHAAVEYLQALPSNQAIYLDGQQIQMEAYSINGSNYVKLRDIGEAVGFNVYWDGAVQIDSDSPYTGTAPQEQKPEEPVRPEAEIPATEEPKQVETADLSQQANSEVFKGTFTREMYNGIRQTVLNGGSGDAFEVSAESRQKVNTVLSNIGTAYQYQLKAQLDGSYICIGSERKAYATAIAAVEGLLDEINALPDDAAKVRYINEVICDRLTYQSGSVTMPNKLFTTSGVLAGNCASYAKNFKFLCDLAGIPCIHLTSSTGQSHGWNMVYVDGAWSHVDCVANDVGDDTNYRNGILMDADPAGTLYVDAYPEITGFCKELLVPDSTK